MTQSNATQRIDELTVQRLNVVDANGTLRLVLSNKDRMHPGVRWKAPAVVKSPGQWHGKHRVPRRSGQSNRPVTQMKRAVQELSRWKLRRLFDAFGLAQVAMIVVRKDLQSSANGEPNPPYKGVHESSAIDVVS
jgi:hypothetical protein